MTEEFERSERIWRCHCHYSSHFVALVADPLAPDVADDPRAFGWFFVEVTDGPMRFTAGAKEAWKLLRSRGSSRSTRSAIASGWLDATRSLYRDRASALRPRTSHAFGDLPARTRRPRGHVMGLGDLVESRPRP